MSANSRFALLPLLASALVASGGAISAADRPNILWLVSEDNTSNYVGAYGDPLARTPHLDRLAHEGITFDRVYTEPVCAPSRSTIITGCHASSLGTQHMRSTRPLPAGVRFFPEYLREAGYFCTNNAKTDYNTSTSWDHAWDENGKTAHWRHRRAGQPFFAVFNFEESHESRLMVPRPLTTDPAMVRVPRYLPDTAVVRGELAQYYDCVSRADDAIGRVLAELESDGQAENTIVFYYSDNGGAVAGSKRFLNEAGTHVAMIARFPEKFARYAPAKPGSHFGEMINFVDLAPTVLSLAGLALPAHFQGRAFCGPARTAAPEFTFMFADRMDERYNLVRAVSDGRYLYIRNFYPDRPWGQQISFLWKLASMREWALHYQAGILDRERSRFFEPQPAESLYDCEADPDNVHDFASDPAQHGRVVRMRTALRDHMLSIRDTGFMPEPMMIDAASGRSPVVVASDNEKYPLARILELLDTIQLGDASVAAQAAEAGATDPLPVVRYWSAVAALRVESTGFVEALLTDIDPVVRVAAAESLLHRSDEPAATHVIDTLVMQTQRPELRLFALDAFARTGRASSKTLAPVLRQIAASDDFLGIDYYLARVSRLLLKDHGEHDFQERLRAAQ